MMSEYKEDVDIGEIDGEHKVQISLIHALEISLDQGDGKSDSSKIF